MYPIFVHKRKTRHDSRTTVKTHHDQMTDDDKPLLIFLYDCFFVYAFETLQHTEAVLSHRDAHELRGVLFVVLNFLILQFDWNNLGTELLFKIFLYIVL